VSAVDERDLIGHLDHCGACQRALELVAAGGEGLLLAARSADAESFGPALADVLGRLKEDAPGTGDGSDGDGDTIDHFEYLSPSSTSGHIGRLGHYAVLETIGRGGMGVVFRAFDEQLHRVVAIKVLASRLAASDAARERFIREARAVAAIHSDHVVAIHAVEEAAGRPYLVMEYVAGGSLEARLRAGPLPPADVLRVGEQTARGLAAAHARGVIHRDIKPANVLIGPGGRIKITDFGLACAADEAEPTAAGTVAGTPAYMAPEQARGEPVDHRADLFSLGSLLFALATGRPPLEGDALAVIQEVGAGRTELPPGSVTAIPPGLAAVIDRLRAPAPADRFASADEVADVLGYQLRRMNRAVSTRTWWGALAAILLVAAGFTAWAIWGSMDTPGGGPVARRPLPPRVLLVLPGHDFSYPDYITVRSTLVNNGFEVVVTSSAADEAVPMPNRPDFAEPVPVNWPIQEANGADYGAVCFLGGSGVLEYAKGGKNAPAARRLIAEAQGAGRLIAAVGTGPVVLAEAGVLHGEATCYRWDPPKNEVPGRYVRRLEAAGATWVDRPFVIDGTIVTGQGSGHTAGQGPDTVAFARALVEQLKTTRAP
jgi:putative intracellular protease/amidase